MSVYFVRHKTGGGSSIARQLKDQQLIAFHFADEFHKDLKDYSEQSRGLTQAFNAFNSLKINGGIIVAEYSDNFSFVVGTVKAGEEISPLTIPVKDHQIVLKTMKFSNPKEFRYSKYPLLAAIRPPYSTICSTGPSYSQLIRHIYLDEPLEISLDFMHPSSIELMCDYFLKSELVSEDIRLSYTLLRTGKTMPSVDIYGRSIKDKKVFAQVTYAQSNLNKVRDLVNFVNGDGISIYFSRDKKFSFEGLDYHFNLYDVFDKFKNSDNSIWNRMLREMIGIE